MSVEFEKDEHEKNIEPLEPLTGADQIYEKIYDMAGKFASTDFGQFVIDRIDRVLCVLEVTAKWSLPMSTGDETETDKTDPRLQRPLPWIPFLFTIVVLRSMRMVISLAAIFIGNNPVNPEDMVHFIQTRRRKLRAIKYRGVRIIRNREMSTNNKPPGMMSKLSSILSLVVCRPGNNKDNSTVQVVEEKKETTANKEMLNSNTNQVSKKRRIGESISDTSDDDLNVEEMLEKYGNKDSEVEDEDFVPPQFTKSDSSSTSTEDEEENEYATSNGSNKDNIHDDIDLVTPNGVHENIKFPIPLSEIKEEQYKPTYNSFSPSYLKKNLENSNDYLSPMSTVQNGTNGNQLDDESHSEAELQNSKKKSNPTAFEFKAIPISSSKNSTTTTSMLSNFITIPPTTTDNAICVIPVPTTTTTTATSLSRSPATSNEDLFYSPIGSPDFHSNFDSYMSNNDTMVLLNQLQDKANEKNFETVVEKGDEGMNFHQLQI